MTRTFFRAVVVCGVLAFGRISVPAVAGEVRMRSREGRHASLIELYTSEGCSSCPPAEAWLSRLTNSAQLWTEIVPVAFHVDYWDNRSWRDRFAVPAWTARQWAYAVQWGRGSTYTPGLVLDGFEWTNWSSYHGGALPKTPADHQGNAE